LPTGGSGKRSRFWIGQQLDVPAKTARRLKLQALNRQPALTVPDSQAARQMAYHYALAIAACDGKLIGREREIAELLGAHLGLSRSEITTELHAAVAADEPKRRRRRRRSRQKRPRACQARHLRRPARRSRGQRTVVHGIFNTSVVSHRIFCFRGIFCDGPISK
jgi:hypothetical protein